MRMKTKGYILISLAVIELSLLTVVSGLGVANISVLQLLFYSFLTSTAVSFLALLASKRLRLLLNLFANKKAFSVLVIAGILNYAVAQLFLTIAVKGTNPIVVSLILKLWPIFLALMLPFTLKIKLHKGQFVALLLGFMGVYFLATHGSIMPKLFGIFFIGIGILSTLSTASSNVLIRSQNQDVFSEVFIFNASSLLFVVLLILIFNVHFTPMNSYAIISFLFLGGISYSLGALMFFYTFRMFDPLLMSNATYATPILTIIFSNLILGTKFYMYYAYSFALIITALIIQQHYASKAPTYVTNKHKQTMMPIFDLSGAFVNTKNSEIINAIGRSGRALGVKLSTELNPDLIDAGKYGCIIFTTKHHKGYVSPEELEFIEEIIGANENDDVLVCVGKQEMAEQAIKDYIEKININVPSSEYTMHL